MPAGSVGLTWLRQAGFLIEGPTAAIAVDPFLTEADGMLVPAAFRPEELGWLDAVLATHEHGDHLDLPAWRAIEAGSTRPRFVVAAPLRSVVTGAGIDDARVIGTQPGEVLAFGSMRVTPVPARHGVGMEDAYDHGRQLSGGQDRYLGYVVDVDGVRVYHAGDCTIDDEVIDAVTAQAVHIALLPINGRDWFRERRGIVGNMDGREAAELAARIGASVVIPMHYDTYPGNTAPVGPFVDFVRAHHPELSVAVPARGVQLRLSMPGQLEDEGR